MMNGTSTRIFRELEKSTGKEINRYLVNFSRLMGLAQMRY